MSNMGEKTEVVMFPVCKKCGYVFYEGIEFIKIYVEGQKFNIPDGHEFNPSACPQRGLAIESITIDRDKLRKKEEVRESY